MTSIRKAPAAFAALLSGYSRDVQALARAARKLVLAVLPDAAEQVDPPDRLIAYSVGPKMKDVVFTLMPLKAGLNLGVANGASLPDPAGLLAGTGKRHRHVRLTTLEDAANPALRALLEAAAGRRMTSD
jgi:hypothetical protein